MQTTPSSPTSFAAAASAAASALRVGARYALVLRLRPDLCFCGPLDLLPVLRSPSSFWLPWAAPQAGLAFDQIAVGSASAMALYASAYRASVVDEVEADRRELYPEAVMWRHLKRHGGVSASTDAAMAVRPAVARQAARGHLAVAEVWRSGIAHLAGFRASLARHRADGSPHYDDPYGKLRQDLLAPTVLNEHAIGRALPPHQCKPRDYAHRYSAGVGAAQQQQQQQQQYTCAEPTCRHSGGGGGGARKAARKASRSGKASASD